MIERKGTKGYSCVISLKIPISLNKDWLWKDIQYILQITFPLFHKKCLNPITFNIATMKCNWVNPLRWVTILLVFLAQLSVIFTRCLNFDNHNLYLHLEFQFMVKICHVGNFVSFIFIVFMIFY